MEIDFLITEGKKISPIEMKSFIWGSFYEKSKPPVSSKRIPAFLMSNEVTKETADVIINTLNAVILHNAECCPMYSCDETSQRYAV